MKVLFEDKDLEELINTGQNHRYRKYARDKKFMFYLRAVIHNMRVVENISQLAQFSNLDFEKLKYIENRYSVKVMRDHIERVIFKKLDKGISVEILKLNNDHYASLR